MGHSLHHHMLDAMEAKMQCNIRRHAVSDAALVKYSRQAEDSFYIAHQRRNRGERHQKNTLEPPSSEVIDILNRSSSTLVDSLLVYDILQFLSQTWNVKI
ncbi:hypothetical protein V6N11_044807 [Hibiscus sabdariffa]|uniref:Uncharacterized protein n=1 Tax=Hibiscus sabdariffa TaxID=183260 RepID=A0ABR2PTY8_9ROSI